MTRLLGVCFDFPFNNNVNHGIWTLQEIVDLYLKEHMWCLFICIETNNTNNTFTYVSRKMLMDIYLDKKQILIRNQNFCIVISVGAYLL